MNLKAKRYEESHRQKAQEELAARLALLKERGIEPKTMEKDTIVRKLKADLRKAKHRLVGVASQEKLLEQKVQNKQEKAAAELQSKQAPKAEPAKKEAAKPAKKEKKPKEKKAAPAA
ncbi:MAG: hypothetical protein HZB87_03025 [Desulfatitalea sp.]|nr:hypothetical protein [Desulfatitalea sp.]MBI5896331.1 hypothetical protein [Desulfobacterales bacterium]